MADELFEVMRCAPSTRTFTDEPVAREVLERVLDNARFAPSGGNRQGWRVIVITDPDIRRRLRELYEDPWDAYMIRTGGRAALDAGEASGLPAGRLRMLRGADEYARRFDQVPVGPHRLASVRNSFEIGVRLMVEGLGAEIVRRHQDATFVTVGRAAAWAGHDASTRRPCTQVSVVPVRRGERKTATVRWNPVGGPEGARDGGR